jgi:molecular chaperone GrpE (heat shock protein)
MNESCYRETVHGNIKHDANFDNINDGKIEKDKERNREHAKKTRLRKKAAIENLKERLIELQREVSI